VIPLFVGYDPRESAVYHVLNQSLLDATTEPVSVTALHAPQLNGFDGQQDGTNAFIYSRFLVPELMKFDGWAVYCDSDMLFVGDLKELWDLRDDKYAVMVVKHDYETTRNIKFVGTPIESPNESYPRKNWSSLILWNCGHPKNRILTRDYVSSAGGKILHRFSWLNDEHIGDVPREWNHLCGEYAMEAHVKNVHYTLGAPGFAHYQDCHYSYEWHQTLLNVNHMIGRDPVEMVRRAKNGF